MNRHTSSGIWYPGNDWHTVTQTDGKMPSQWVPFQQLHVTNASFSTYDENRTSRKPTNQAPHAKETP